MFIFCVGPIYLLVADKASKSCTTDGFTKGLKFRALALGDEFNAAIGQIAHEAGNFKTGGDGFDGITETDALHAA